MQNLLENLNKEQSEAVKHESGPLLIVAGAGTGKTTVITRRVAYLIEKKLAKPDEILALTFTEKAAGEMQERVDLLLPLGFHDLWISTFHSFCERILKNHALDIGLPNDFTLLDDVKQWIFVHKNFDKFNLDYYRPLGSPNKFIDALLNHFSRCKDELITPESYLEYAQGLKLSADNPEGLRTKKDKSENRQVGKSDVSELSDQSDSSEILRITEVANAFHTYEKLKLDNNFLDFGDLINYTLQLFQKRPKILAYYQKKFRYIMVDEFQDTNFAQYQLVRLLTGDGNGSAPIHGLNMDADKLALSADRPAHYTSSQNLVVVGDDDQSIYKFRGASVSNILKFREDYPKAKLITLIDNYRSSQNILDLAYNFIQANNPDRLEVKLKIDKKLKSNTLPASPPSLGRDKRGLGIIKVLESEDLSGELNEVAKKILELKNRTLSVPPKAGHLPQEGEKNKDELSWNDFAVLIRANAAANELLPILTHNGIPFTFVANRGLYKKPIVVDVLAYMNLLNNFHDSTALFRVLNLPKFHLPQQEISTLLLLAHKKTLSLFEAIQLAVVSQDLGAESKTKIQTLKDLLLKHSAALKTSTAAEMMVKTVKDLGLEQKLLEDTLENAENRELLEQFYKKIEDFEKDDADKSLHSFLSFLDLEMQAGSDGIIKFDPNLGPESLKILTIHSAKGLEFKYVFLINLVDQRFPTREKGESIEIPEPLIKDILPEGDFHLQEERRLFYVAVTRAKQHLYLSWAKDYGGVRAKKPSQFLIETKLVPSDKVSKATGKVFFGRPEKTKVVYQTLPSQFSYSQLNDFQTCPLKYKYQHYLKLPVPGSPALSFGSTMHKVFEEYLKLYKNQQQISQADLFGKQAARMLPGLKTLEELYAKNWIDDWYENKLQKDEYRKLGRQMLQTFYESIETQKPKPKYIEQFFKLPLGDYTFVGKIDRADETTAGLEILDYKTGKAPKSSKDLDQLYIYQWVVQDFLKEKVIGLKYWYLQDNQLLSEEPANQEEIAKLKAKLLKLIEEIVDATKYDKFRELHKNSPKHKCDFTNFG